MPADDLLEENAMDKAKTYITDEERINCQKVADAFAEISDYEDLMVFNAGKYGFVKIQYFKLPFGFDSVTTYFDSRSLFDDLWEEWLDTQLLNFAVGTPMEEMDYEDILKCLPKERQKELADKRSYFADKAGIGNLLLERTEKPKETSEDYKER